NLATNHIVRVAPIVKALQRDHDVKLIGILKEDEELFPPFAKEFDYTVVRLTGRGGFLGALRRVQEELTGDLVYAFQALPLSFGAGLLRKLRRRRPVILDITDWEACGAAPRGAGAAHHPLRAPRPRRAGAGGEPARLSQVSLPRRQVRAVGRRRDGGSHLPAETVRRRAAPSWAGHHGIRPGPLRSGCA